MLGLCSMVFITNLLDCLQAGHLGELGYSPASPAIYHGSNVSCADGAWGIWTLNK